MTNIDKLIETECPSCLKQVMFKYIGEQEVKEGDNLFLYDCSGCGTTLSLRHIRDHNHKKYGEEIPNQLTEDEYVDGLPHTD